jgi:hypothetical protein
MRAKVVRLLSPVLNKPADYGEANCWLQREIRKHSEMGYHESFRKMTKAPDGLRIYVKMTRYE